MSIFRIQRTTSVLLVLCILLNISIGHCEKKNVIINVNCGPNHSYMQAHLLESIYERFQEMFFDSKTQTVTLRYQFLQNGNKPYITRIEKDDFDDLDNNILYYFRCSVKQGNLSIICRRLVQCYNFCVNYCPYGFGISWQDGEYLYAKSFENITTNCVSEEKVTCYKLKDNYTPPKTAFLPTTTSSNIVYTDFRTSFELSSEPTEAELSTGRSTNTSFASTMYLKDYSREGSHSDSTAVMAGVTAGVLIACVIVVVVIIVIRMRRKVKKASRRQGKTEDSSLEMTSRPIDDSDHREQILNLDKDIITNKSTSENVIVEDDYTQYNYNTNKYTNSINKDNIANHEPNSIAGSDFEDVDKDCRIKMPLKLLNTDTDIEVDYYTIDHNQGSLISALVNQDGCQGNYSNEVNHSVITKEQRVSSPVQYATVNKDDGYKNFIEIEQIKHTVVEHEYNNIKDDITKIGINEPTKNVYSKLRENNHHFEHTYGVDQVALPVRKENSSTLSRDKTYSLMESERNMN